MSKRRKRRSNCKKRSKLTCTDRHHLLYQRRHWQKGYLSELRLFWYCIILIQKDPLHRLIHEYVGDVPTPREVSAKEALKQLRLLEKYGAISENDSIEKRLIVLIALFESSDQPTAEALKRQLNIVRKYTA